MRENLIKFIIQSVKDIEGVKVRESEYKDMTDAELVMEAEWYEYLLTK